MSILDCEDVHVAHLTSVHARTDSRVFSKECRSLCRAGYRVTLVVADGLGDAEFEDRLRVVDVGAPTDRLRRMVGTTRIIMQYALALDADVYHLHDPEMLPVGIALKRRGKKVVFDSHEDVPKQILGKAYMPMPVLRAVSRLYRPFEAWAVGRLDGVIAATPSIADKFRPLARRVATVKNFPLRDELSSNATENCSAKPAQVCYVGGISRERGILGLVEALELCESGARLELAGTFSEATVRAKAVSMPGWAKVDERGFCDRHAVREILARSVAGMVVLHPVPNHVESLPVKMFEYMSAGIPVIASDFLLWRSIIDEARCGLCVDPSNPRMIAQAIDRLVSDPAFAEELGQNGRKAVERRFNWGTQEEVLERFYRDVLAEPQ